LKNEATKIKRVEPMPRGRPKGGDDKLKAPNSEEDSRLGRVLDSRFQEEEKDKSPRKEDSSGVRRKKESNRRRE